MSTNRRLPPLDGTGARGGQLRFKQRADSGSGDSGIYVEHQLDRFEDKVWGQSQATKSRYHMQTDDGEDGTYNVSNPGEMTRQKLNEQSIAYQPAVSYPAMRRASGASDAVDVLNKSLNARYEDIEASRADAAPANDDIIVIDNEDGNSLGDSDDDVRYKEVREDPTVSKRIIANKPNRPDSLDLHRSKGPKHYDRNKNRNPENEKQFQNKSVATIDDRIKEAQEELTSARTTRRDLERRQDDLVKHSRTMQRKVSSKQHEARDQWRKKYFEQKKKTGPMEEDLTALLVEEGTINSRQMAALSQKRGFKDDRARKKNQNVLLALRLEHENDSLQQRINTAKMKLTTEMKLRYQAQEQLKDMRADLSQKRIQATLSHNAKSGYTKDDNAGVTGGGEGMNEY